MVTPAVILLDESPKNPECPQGGLDEFVKVAILKFGLKSVPALDSFLRM